MKTFYDLFGGIGGFSYGLKDCRCECVGYCDISKYAVGVYNYNFGCEYVPTDITTVNTRDMPDFNILCGGFPCQSFSVAGKQRGFEDTRGTVFYEIARIANDKQPEFLFLENVRGLLTHDSGKTFATVITTLGELGYQLQFIVYNTRYEGCLPQNRERVFIIGYLGDRCPGEVLHFREDVTGDTDARSRTYSEEEWIPNTVSCIDSNYWKGGSTRSMIVQPILTPNRLKKRQNGRRMKEDGEPMFTLTAQDIHGVYLDKRRVRRLTPIECERLQGFPDDWTRYMNSGQEVSDLRRYTLIGNAVTTTVIAYIANALGWQSQR